MKILYVCHFADSGWGYAAYDWIKAIHTAGLDVVVRNIKLNNASANVPELIKELEAKSSRGCDVVIQNVLPHHMEYNGHLKNIGSYFYETDDLKYSLWNRKLKMMDQVWCPNKILAKYTQSFTQKKVSVIPPASNTEKFAKEYPTFSLPRDDFTFYTIADLNVRKNLKALITAFHLEFRVNEPVSLVLKVNKFGEDPNVIFDNIKSDIGKIKHSLKLYPSESNYKYEKIITESVPEEHIYGIHQSCDCFVTTSHGEGWSIPAMDALGFGNPVLAPTGCAFDDYVPTPMLFNTYKSPCFGLTDTFSELYTGRGNWLETDIDSLRKKMRVIYESSKIENSWSEMRELMKTIPEKYSFEKIGKLIKETLGN